MENLCLEIAQETLLEKISFLEGKLKELQQSDQNDSKSSAGDKYETSIERTAQEKSQLFGQLSLLQKEQMTLQKIRISGNNKRFFSTSLGDFYVGIPLGEIKIEDKSVFFVSGESPIGKILLQNPNAKTLDFNGKTLEIYP